jgi:hypothetical protein
MDCLFSTSCGSGGRGKGANKWNETGTKTGVLSTCSRFNRVVHSSHFWLIFDLIFGPFLRVWQEIQQNDDENGIKNGLKMGYCETPGMQKLQK